MINVYFEKRKKNEETKLFIISVVPLINLKFRVKHPFHFISKSQTIQFIILIFS